MKTKALLTVGGVDLPSPTKYDLKFADVDSSASGRSDDGYMIRERVRSNVVSIDVGWTMITNDEVELIKKQLQNAEFDVVFFTGGSRTSASNYEQAKMYVGDRSFSLMARFNQDEDYWSLNCTFIAY